MVSGIRKHPAEVAILTTVAIVGCFALTSTATLDSSTLQAVALAAIVIVAIVVTDRSRFLFYSAPAAPVAKRSGSAAKKSDSAAKRSASAAKTPARFPWVPAIFLIVVAAASVLAVWLCVRGANTPASSSDTDTVAGFLSGYRAPAWGLVPELIVLCVGTALFEEGFFRVVLFDAAVVSFDDGRPGRDTVLRAAIILSVLFGLLHVMGAWCYIDGVVTVWQVILKPLGACLFGLSMTALYVRTRSVSTITVVHTIYDIIVLGPYILATGNVQTNYVTGSISDLVSMAATVVLLVPLAIWAVGTIRRGSATYRPMFVS